MSWLYGYVGLASLRRLRRRIRLAVSARIGSLPEPEKWIFVVGCTNSGTTLLHDILAAHPAVGSLPSEGQYCTDQLLRPASVGLPRLWAAKPELFRMVEDSDGVDVQRLKKQWGAHFDDPKRPVLLEKTVANAARVRWLDRHFRNAHFIGIVRNGYAVAEGIRRKEGHGIDMAVGQWVRSNEMMLADLDAVARGRWICYERLVTSPEAVLFDLFAFLGMDPSEVRVFGQECQIGRKRITVRDMNPRSLGALDSDDRAAVERAAGPMLRRLGYGIAGPEGSDDGGEGRDS